MSNAEGRLAAIAAATALVLGAPSSEARIGAAPAARPQHSWNSFSADISIRRGVRGPEHQPGGDAPAVIYRWERSQQGGRWKSTMRVISSGRPDVVTPAGNLQAIPPVIARIEDDEDGTGPRFYNLQGSLVRPPTMSDRRKMGAAESVFAKTDALVRPAALAGAYARVADTDDRSWVEAVLPSSDGKGRRKINLQRRYGQALKTQRGLDRYVQTVGDETIELLADAEWGVPVEINRVRRGALTSHTSFVYEPGPGGALVRRRSRAEHVMPESRGARMVLDVELANLKLEDRK